MPKLVGSVCAFIALAFGVVRQLPPATTLMRGAVSFVVGWVAASIVAAFVGQSAVAIQTKAEPRIEEEEA